jgi:Kef-type K+ transport system membrane component KefB
MDVQPAALLVLLLGVSVALALLLKALLKRVALPDLIGYLAIGLALRFADARFDLISDGATQGFELLAEVGVVALLFHIGVRSKLGALLAQLPKASVVWFGSVSASGLLGFAIAYYFLGLELTASLFAAVALTASSVGVSVSVYESAGALDREQGRLFLDAAELDDISAVVLMALLFAIAPVLQRGSGGVASVALAEGALLLFKLLLFAAICYWFSRGMVPRLLRYLKRLELGADPLVTVLAIGLVIAAVAAFLGFTLAIGAFFAGVVFSRDREFVRKEASLTGIYDFVIPFFFIGIGLRIDPNVLGDAVGLAGPARSGRIRGKTVGDGAARAPVHGLARRPRVGPQHGPACGGDHDNPVAGQRDRGRSSVAGAVCGRGNGRGGDQHVAPARGQPVADPRQRVGLIGSTVRTRLASRTSGADAP